MTHLNQHLNYYRFGDDFWPSNFYWIITSNLCFHLLREGWDGCLRFMSLLFTFELSFLLEIDCDG